jgi:hypothetical protein
MLTRDIHARQHRLGMMHTCFERSRLSSASSSFANLNVLSRCALPIRTSSCCSPKQSTRGSKSIQKFTHLSIHHTQGPDGVREPSISLTENQTMYDVLWMGNYVCRYKKRRLACACGRDVAGAWRLLKCVLQCMALPWEDPSSHT